jgi:thiol-disulfide isomerase/thioredoxin
LAFHSIMHMKGLRWALATAFAASLVLLLGSVGAETEDDAGASLEGGSSDTVDLQTTTAPQQTEESMRTMTKNSILSWEPTVLTSRNFGGHVADGNVWLVEIYAPWCGHCVQFESTYKEIAAEYHASSPKKYKNIRVGKINGDAEQALVSRFGVASYPSFFIVDGFSVYEFDQPRSKSTLMAFAEGGYKKTSPIPWYKSPCGPLGLAQGMILWAGYTMADIFYWLQNKFGLSTVFAGMVMFGSLFIGTFITLVAMAIIFTPKAKID